MKLAAMPGTDLTFKPLALGTAEFGSAVSEEESFRIMDRFVEAGGSWIDTARVYADWLADGHGKSEITVGKWLEKSGLRERVLISTKGGHPRLESMNVSRLSEAEIRSDAEESLRWLGVDTIDIYWLHRDDESIPVMEVLRPLNRLVKEGKIRYFGCSNWRPYRIREAAAAAAAHGVQTFSASQIQWSLADTNEGSIEDTTTVEMDKEGYEFHAQTGLSLFAFTPQAKGFFQKLHAGGPDSLKAAVRNIYYNEVNLGRMERVAELSGQLNVSISSIVLSYLISQPFTVIPVIGTSSFGQIEEALESLEVRLTPSQVKYLEQG
ncbi:Predicted oxidoreductase [Paenibacillus sophorae]|uniref:Aldo/keto reductase n=1 Tax=Paenibacillus sophorae TaxID=1333845 RepID=A0A1H8S7E8_9BACL|nr:aldo/keto reductase [Paenibacillus sophorae]QWU16850.1 aldo/keto reductase [Paenibacillus sophorae]SEO74601.1 Predicted oxidoreductase [Paenibacillus sophorae]